MRQVIAAAQWVGRAWTRFWFAESSPSTLTLLRVAFGVLMAVWALVLLPDAGYLFSSADGVGVGTTWVTDPLTVLTETSNRAVLVVGAVAVAATGVALGRAPRTCAFILWLGLVTLHASHPAVFNTGDRVLRTLAFVLMVSPLHRTPGWHRPVAAGTTVARWPLRLPQLVLTVAYPSSIGHKLTGRTWLEGTSIGRVFRLEDLSRWVDLPPEIAEAFWFSAPLSWAALLVQALIPLLIWFRKTRWIAVLLGVGLHGGIDVILTVGFFFPAMMLLYLAFTPPETADRWIAGLTGGEPVPTLRAPTP